MKTETTYKLIDDIENLSLDKFISCICEQKLECLVIEGSPPQSELLECWANLYSQYLDASEDSETLYIFQLQKEILLLRQKISEVENCIYFLSIIYHQGLVDIIRRNGFAVKLNPQNQTQYQSDINKIKGRLALLKLNLENKEHELDSYRKGRQAETIDKMYFNKILARLAVYKRVVVIRTKEIMTLEFVYMLKDYLQHIQSHSKTIDQDGAAW
jgi:hypothetical protein